MYWWGKTQQIDVLVGTSSGPWQRSADTFREGERLAPVSPPPGLHAPERGFGTLWRDYTEIQAILGWARWPEVDRDGAYQPFERGAMLYSKGINGHDEHIYVLFDDGTYVTLTATP